jgi:hypothetical protein
VVGRSASAVSRIAAPVSAVRRFARHVVPGGVVAFGEYQIDFPSGLSLMEGLPLWEQAVEWIRATFRRAGAATNMGVDLHRVFVDAGLGAPAMHMGTYLITAADRLGPRVAAHVLRSILPLAERFGVASAGDMGVDTFAERFHAEIVSKGAVVPWPPLVSAWSRITSATNGSS